jgi:ketosteroid isomerase-like protein
MYTLTVADFENWLRGYKRAWEGRDAEAAAALFTPDAEYYWTPFDPPQRGRAEITGAWSGAVQGQRDITFDYEVFATSGARGCAHWHTRLTTAPGGAPLEFDAILIAEFAAPGQCRVFREWWHQKGPAA